MSDYKDISEQMRADWDRRITHDYRFWMSDGYHSDDEMWKSGERDFSILVDGIEDCQEKTILEIGCGVGRLLRAASKRFKQVIGLDVSEEAVKKARAFLADSKNVEVICGNGVDLSELPDNSIDLVTSFAAITSVPTEIIANYFREIHRVLRPGGEVRMQCYLGTEQSVGKTDTLHLRCFKEENFKRAVEQAGFEL